MADTVPRPVGHGEFHFVAGDKAAACCVGCETQGRPGRSEP